MFRKRLIVSRFALGIIAVENIVKPACGCMWHKLGKPEFCEQLNAPIPTYPCAFDEWPDDYPDFDRDFDSDFDDSCHCYNCRSGHRERCVMRDDIGIFEDIDAAWDEIDLTFICDGSVRFDDVPEPVVRVNKFTRVYGRSRSLGYGGDHQRSWRSMEHEARKMHFMLPRRSRARIGTVLAREESVECELQLESDMRYFDAWFPEDNACISSDERVELLQRNFPGIGGSSAKCIASSRRIQASASFKGLEGLQQWEVEELCFENERALRSVELDFEESLVHLQEIISFCDPRAFA